MSEKVQSAQKAPVVGWVLKKPLGFERLQGGLDLVASKTQELGQAHVKLGEGAQTIEHGLKKSLDGVDSLESGLVKLQGGLAKVSDGNQKAADGARLLSAKLGDASQKLHVQDPEKLAEVAASPVQLKLEMVNPVPNYGTGFAPFFIPLVLWIGAIALFFMLDARDGKLNLSTASSLEIVLGRFLVFGGIGVAQALTLSFSLQGLLGLRPVHPIWFTLVNVMLSLTFVAWVQVLIGLFNLAGRFIVLILLLLQLTSSGGTFPLELCPPFFRTVSPYLPLSYGVKLLRPVLSGGLTQGQLQESFSILFIMLAGALGVMIVLLRRRAMVRELFEPSPVF
jgi:putative membrane protein